ncbi:uncharacterized protein LOC142772216 [Rhipicephalus microplus]|uniref:uncharacterized protein LOC142772216 n=1 Tax=Rhipicephalus microplus TaxID=6941 RepID=UPI003F6B141D
MRAPDGPVKGCPTSYQEPDRSCPACGPYGGGDGALPGRLCWRLAPELPKTDPSPGTLIGPYGCCHKGEPTQQRGSSGRDFPKLPQTALNPHRAQGNPSDSQTACSPPNKYGIPPWGGQRRCWREPAVRTPVGSTGPIGNQRRPYYHAALRGPRSPRPHDALQSLFPCSTSQTTISPVQCGQYGHVKGTCNWPDSCISCGRSHLGESDCQRFHCVNCGGPHRADTLDCPRWQEQRRVATIVASSTTTFSRRAIAAVVREETREVRSYTRVVKCHAAPARSTPAPCNLCRPLPVAATNTPAVPAALSAPAVQPPLHVSTPAAAAPKTQPAEVVVALLPPEHPFRAIWHG